LTDEIVPQTLPAAVLARVRELDQGLARAHAGRLVRLTYAGDQAYEPILSHLIRERGLELSILHGQIDEIQGQAFGSLAVYLSGTPADIERATRDLQARGVLAQVQEAAVKEDSHV